jgi:tetratricopeptide (TPR) repeat protein
MRSASMVFFSRVSMPSSAEGWARRRADGVDARPPGKSEGGEWGGALPDLRRATELAPAQAGHWFNLGYVLAQLERQDEAVAAFREATQRDAKLDAAWYGLGLALLQLGRLDEAVAALKRNTELQPMSPYGWTQLARAHARAEQPAKARKVVEHLRGFEPKVAEALIHELKLEPQQ